MPENEDAWELWLAVHTQWRMGGMGPCGLDYPAVVQVAGLLGIEMSTPLLRKIQCLERHDLAKLADRNGKGRQKGPKNA